MNLFFFILYQRSSLDTTTIHKQLKAFPYVPAQLVEIPQIPLAIEDLPLGLHVRHYQSVTEIPSGETTIMAHQIYLYETCLLYTSDAADE